MSQRFLSNGQWVPFGPGATLENYTIKARRQWVDSYFYLADGPHGEVVIHESMAYFQKAWQEQVFENMTEAMQAQGFCCEQGPIWFQKTWQKITINYIEYPAWLWEALNHSLQEELWQAGQIDESTLRNFHNWMQSLQQNLSQKGWCNPSLVLPMILHYRGQFLLLEWHCAVPLDDTLIYPRFFEGYHSTSTRQSSHLTTQAGYYTFLALLQGKPPRFWGAEPMNDSSIRPLLSLPMRTWLENNKNNDTPEQWEQLPEQIYRSEAPLETYMMASKHFNIGFAAYQENDLSTAIYHASLSTEYWLSDPWPLFLLARCAQKSNSPEGFHLAQKYLDQALRLQQPGVFHREKAQIALQQNDLNTARNQAEKALKQAPHDDFAWYLYSLIMERLQILNKAEDAAQKACDLKPLNSAYRKHLMTILRQMGAENEALHTHYFASGQPLHMNCEFTRKEHLPPTLQPPGPWTFAGHQNTAESIKTGYPVVHAKSGVKGFLKLFQIANQADRQAFTDQHYLLESLYSAHPSGFANCIDSYIKGRHGFMIYTWKEGESLQKQMEAQGLFETNHWKTLALGSVKILDTLQQNKAIHGDISPANLIFQSVKKEPYLALIDYDTLQTNAFRNMSQVQTPEYAPPEFSREHNTNKSTDAYSFALVLLQSATGLFPDLCKDWEKQNFEGYRRYAGHLPHAVCNQLLQAVHWKESSRKPLDLTNLVEQVHALKRSVPLWVKTLSQSIQKVSQATDIDTLVLAQKSLLAQEHSAMTYYHLAFHYLRLEAFTKAASFAKACLKLDTFHMGARWILSDTFMKQNQREQAKHVLLQAAGQGVKEPETYLRLLTIYCLQNQRDLALGVADQLEKQLPGNVEVRIEKASVLAHFNLYHQAAEYLQELSKNNLPTALQARIRRLKENCLTLRKQNSPMLKKTKQSLEHHQIH